MHDDDGDVRYYRQPKSQLQRASRRLHSSVGCGVLMLFVVHLHLNQVKTCNNDVEKLIICIVHIHTYIYSSQPIHTLTYEKASIIINSLLTMSDDCSVRLRVVLTLARHRQRRGGSLRPQHSALYSTRLHARVCYMMMICCDVFFPSFTRLGGSSSIGPRCAPARRSGA